MSWLDNKAMLRALTQLIREKQKLEAEILYWRDPVGFKWAVEKVSRMVNELSGPWRMDGL